MLKCERNCVTIKSMKQKFVILLLLIFGLGLSPVTFANAAELSIRLKGKIVLQVEDVGQAWYVDPVTAERAFLGRPADAFRIMRELGLGISEKDYNSFAGYAPIRLSGKILLRVGANGEAYYVFPDDLKMHYLGRPVDAFNIMREKGLGIKNFDLNTITVYEKYKENIAINILSSQPSTYTPLITYYTVTKVVDGDTIDVDINGTTERLRLIGIDTPEVVDPRKTVECFGFEASKKAGEILLNQKVRLESDPTQDDRDKYDRLLRYVYRADGLFYNQWMIANGYAHEYTYIMPYKYQDDFQQAERVARADKFGLWHPDACGGNTTSNQQESIIPQDNEEQANGVSDHIFYTSRYFTSKLYYCDTDSAWEGLSEKYLESYTNEASLLKVYPAKTLHKPCN